MKNNVKRILAVLLSIVAVVCLTPITSAQAAKKVKLPKNNQKFYSQTFEELVPASKGNGFWIVGKDETGEKTYKPVVQVKENGKKVNYYLEEMYVVINNKTYYVGEGGYVQWSNPDNYEVSKYGYIIYPTAWKAGTLPKAKQTFRSSTFKAQTGIERGYWQVTKLTDETLYRPVTEGDYIYILENMYVTIDGYTYYLGKDGYVSWKNPDGYSVSKTGYIIYPTPSNTDPEPTPISKPVDNKDPEPTIKPTYTLKKQGENTYCYDEKGNMVTGWVDGSYYFSAWGGMATGLTFVDGEYYYFSDTLGTSMGRMLTNSWKNNMFFGSDGKAIRSQKVEINGKTYRFNESGYIYTGWYGNDEFYSSEPDRYGQLVVGVTK